MRGAHGILRGSARVVMEGFMSTSRNDATVYDGLSLTTQRAAFALRPSFDVFLSYKAEEVNLVRQVADGLIACGYCPWLDEYLILLAERGRFEEAIRVGVENSRWGLLFMSHRYRQSEQT